MTIAFDNRTQEEVPDNLYEIMERVAEKALLYEEFETACEVSISLVTNEEIQTLNEQYRQKDTPTDVLSFPLLTFEEGEAADVNEKDEILLGDIVISIEKAREQAREFGHSLEREMGFLTAHSMLHLLGYDHMEPDDEAEMIEKQNAILRLANLPRE